MKIVAALLAVAGCGDNLQVFVEPTTIELTFFALVFAIGGADGLDESVRAAAGSTLAFGPQTWPHALARAMLAEQLYRAVTILAGSPYHRD